VDAGRGGARPAARGWSGWEPSVGLAPIADF